MTSAKIHESCEVSYSMAVSYTGRVRKAQLKNRLEAPSFFKYLQ